MNSFNNFPASEESAPPTPSDPCVLFHAGGHPLSFTHREDLAAEHREEGLLYCGPVTMEHLSQGWSRVSIINNVLPFDEDGAIQASFELILAWHLGGGCVMGGWGGFYHFHFVIRCFKFTVFSALSWFLSVWFFSVVSCLGVAVGCERWYRTLENMYESW